MPRMIDIGANLTDPMFRGMYNSVQKHLSDITDVLERSISNGVDKLIITGGSLSDSSEALELSKTKDYLYSTVGCHPTRCLEFENFVRGPRAYLEELKLLASQNRQKVVALGEIGLDYDRLHFCPRDIQIKYFEQQLTIVDELNVPLFLHNRNSSNDFFNILRQNKRSFAKCRGVLHSFDGSLKDIEQAKQLDLMIGINGCSLKTLDNLETIKTIPEELLLIETDCPWCEIKQSHESFKYITTRPESVKKEKHGGNKQVKGRNEPANLLQVLEVLARIRGVDIEELGSKIYRNTMNFFKFN